MEDASNKAEIFVLALSLIRRLLSIIFVKTEIYLRVCSPSVVENGRRDASFIANHFYTILGGVVVSLDALSRLILSGIH